jgi:hypothetical protein
MIQHPSIIVNPIMVFRHAPALRTQPGSNEVQDTRRDLIATAPPVLNEDIGQKAGGGLNDNEFWRVIESMHWRNRSDGVMDSRDAISSIKRQLIRRSVEQFVAKYEGLLAACMESRAAEALVGNGYAREVIAAAASHLIAMGETYFLMLIAASRFDEDQDDISAIKFLIDAAEIQPMDDVIAGLR